MASTYLQSSLDASPQNVALGPSNQGQPNTTVRVLHVINGEHYAGAERVQDLLAMRLPDWGFDIGFVCLKPGRFRQARKSRQAPIYDLPMRSKFDLQVVRSLANLIGAEGYSLVHTHTPRSLLVGRPAAALAKVPVVHHIHGQTDTEVHRKLGSRFNAWVERRSLAGAARVIAVSESARDYASAQSISDAKLRLVPNGIPARSSLRVRPTPSGVWTLGTVALFRPRKGLEVLLEALAMLRDSGRQVRLQAVGPFETPAYEREAKQACNRLGLDSVVKWRGFRKDIDAELARMDLFVFPSVLAEGLPMVLLEAMAAGVPIVGSRVDGVVDALGNGRCGLLAEPNNPADLAEKVASFIRGEADWATLRTTAAAWQAERFSDHSMAAGVAGVYREALTAWGALSR